MMSTDLPTTSGSRTPPAWSPAPPPLPQAPPAPSRRADLDWLRVAAMLVVFTVHVAEPFNPWDRWHIQSAEQSKWLGEVVLFAAPWVMPLFMLLAGASAAYALRRRTNAVYLRERVRRVLLPCVLGMLVLVPPLVWLERRLQGRFTGSLLAFYPHFLEGLYPEGNFSWHHLWFLAYLFLFALLTLPLFRQLQAPAARRWLGGLAARCTSPSAVLLLGAPMVVWRFVLWGILPSGPSYAGSFANHALLLPAYVYGYVLAAEPALEDAVARQARVALWPALMMSVAMFAWAWPGDVLLRLPPPTSPGFVALWTMYSFGTWCWLVVALGLGRLLRDRRPAALRHALDLVYPFYLLHQPIIVAVAYVVVQWSVSLPLQLLALTVASFGLTMALCELALLAPPVRSLLGIASAGRNPGARR